MRTARGAWAEREGWWVRREAADGGVSWGEIAPVPGFGDWNLAKCGAVLERLGEEPLEADVDELVRAGGPVGFGFGAARWDWRSSLARGPDYLPVAGLLPAGRRAFEVVESRLEIGFRTFKWKVGVEDTRDEIAMMDDLLARLPEGARLRLDANGGWDRRTAERWLDASAERPQIEYIEQPTPSTNRDLLLGLAGDYPVTLALDESVVDRTDFEWWRDQGWPGVFVIKPVLWGDPADMVDSLTGSKADVVISSGLETVVGARLVLALAFTLGATGRALGVGVWPLFQEGKFDGPPAMPFVRRSEVESLGGKAVEPVTGGEQ